MPLLSASVAVATVLFLSSLVRAGTPAPLVVDDDEVTITETLFDWDGVGEDIDTLITNGGLLTINADSIDADSTHNRTIEVLEGTAAGSGSLLQTNITQGWTLAGEMRIVGTFDGSASTASFLNGSDNTVTVASSGVILLDGGVIESQFEGEIINEGLVEGSGLIGSAGFVNNGIVRAVAGDNDAILRTTFAQNIDLDGTDAVNPGSVEAVDGDLMVQGRLTDNFGGVVTVGADRTIDFQVGWILGTPATLNFVGGTAPATIDSSGIDNGGMNQQNGVTTLRGTVNVVNTGRILGDSVLRGGATVNLVDSVGVLEFGGNTEVQAGVNFLPSGEVKNLPGGVMTTEDGVDFGSVTLANDGRLDIDGDLNGSFFSQSTTGEVLLEVGGTLSEAYEQLLFDSFTQLDGTLSVEFVDGFAASDGDTFELLQGSFTGGDEFDNVDLPTLPEGLDWLIDYNAGELLLTVQSDADPGLEGDYNSDGLVNAADYTVWRDTLDSVTELGADGDDDGVIDQDDYDLWTANYGAESIAPSAVPEPAGLLAACGLAAWALSHHRRQRRQ